MEELFESEVCLKKPTHTTHCWLILPAVVQRIRIHSRILLYFHNFRTKLVISNLWSRRLPGSRYVSDRFQFLSQSSWKSRKSKPYPGIFQALIQVLNVTDMVQDPYSFSPDPQHCYIPRILEKGLLDHSGFSLNFKWQNVRKVILFIFNYSHLLFYEKKVLKSWYKYVAHV